MSVNLNVNTSGENPYVGGSGTAAPIGNGSIDMAVAQSGSNYSTWGPAVNITLSAAAEMSLQFAANQSLEGQQTEETVVVRGNVQNRYGATEYNPYAEQDPDEYWGPGEGVDEGVPVTTPEPFIHAEMVGTHSIKIEINRALTTNERNALNKLKDAIADMDAKIAILPPDGIITLPNGSQVTTNELRELWAKQEFKINETGTSYSNGSTDGEASFNSQTRTLTATYNIDKMVGYSNLTGGLEYLVLHELAHVTAAGLASNAAAYAGDNIMTSTEHKNNEILANDIVRAIQNALGLSILPNAGNGVDSPPTNGGGYSTPAPLPIIPTIILPPGEPLAPII